MVQLASMYNTENDETNISNKAPNRHIFIFALELYSFHPSVKSISFITCHFLSMKSCKEVHHEYSDQLHL